MVGGVSGEFGSRFLVGLGRGAVFAAAVTRLTAVAALSSGCSPETAR